MSRIGVVALALLLAACGGGAGRDGDPQAPSPLPAASGSVSLVTLWRAGAGSGFGKAGVTLGPAIADGVVFTASPGGVVRAFDVQSGRSLWKRDVDASLAAGAGVGEGLVLVATEEGEIVALDAANGETMWQQRVGGEVLTRPLVGRGTVVVSTVDGKVIGLGTIQGNQRWVVRRDLPSLTLRGGAEAVISGDAVMAGFANGRMVAIDAAEGRELWEVTVANPRGRNEIDRLIDIDSRPMLVGNVLYAVAYQGRVTALALDSQRLLWSRDISSYRAVGADDSNVYVTEDEGQVVALDRRTGATVWRQEQLGNRATTGPTAFGGYVAVGDFDGYIHLLSASTGEIVGQTRVGSSGFAAGLLASGVNLYALSRDGTLAALSVRAGG